MNRLWLAGMCCLLGTLAAQAQVPPTTVETRQVGRKEVRTEVRRVSSIIGMEMITEGRQTFGKVVDLVLNEHGCLEYVVVRYENEGLIAVPWGVVVYQPGERHLAISVAVQRDRLADLAFQQDRWPDFYADQYRQRMTTVWGERAFRRERSRETDVDIRRDDRRDRDLRDDRRPGDRPDVRPDVRPEDRRPGDRPDVRPDDRRPGDPPTPPRPDDRRRNDDRQPGDTRPDRTPGAPEPPRTAPPARPDRPD